jgi:phosphonate transport system permease protein
MLPKAPYSFSQASALRKISFLMALLASIALVFSDLEISSASPWFEVQLMMQGFAQPSLFDLNSLIQALFTTLAFAIQGVFVGAILGFLMALGFHFLWVRALAAFIRSIHELFWALLFIQISGLSSLTGFLAILIPFTGIFAKVFAEILEESDHAPERTLNPRTTFLSRLFYTRILIAWPQLSAYGRYRLECAIRSSAILGFVGLPTLGFEMESYFKQGEYAQGAGLLYVFFILIASLKYWVKPAFFPIYAALAFWYLPPVANIQWPLVKTFLSHDIIPMSLRQGDIVGFIDWLAYLWQNVIAEGLINTLVLSQIALVLTGLLALMLFPFSSPLFYSKLPRALGQTGLIIFRSCPEYLLAFIGLIIWGPSMLPAIIALTIHNGSVIAHLLALQTSSLKFRADVSKGVNLYFFETLPRLYGNFVALLLYRWEIILRETAILGMLGIPTLGFYIDSAFEEIRFDRAILLILVTAFLNILVDYIARYLRHQLHLSAQPETL